MGAVVVRERDGEVYTMERWKVMFICDNNKFEGIVLYERFSFHHDDDDDKDDGDEDGGTVEV